MRRAWVAVGVMLLIVACGSERLTVAGYATEVETLVEMMETQFAALDARWESAPPSVDGARDYWEGRLEVRHEYLESIEALNPPAAVEDLHATALDVFDRITAADEVLAARVAALDAITDHWQWVDTPEGQVADAVLEEVFAFCRTSQERFDETGDADGFSAGPWIDPATEQVVKVAFGCPPP